mmetsp:Transcript_3445/g.9662  ORF Transcript_3445/g.9662 Transcript_3445/m.9662 type:complete len:105 (-) Transcript_3445:16-330(-)
MPLAFSMGEAAAVGLDPVLACSSASIICMVIMATPEPTPTPAPARAQRPNKEREVYIAKFADIFSFCVVGTNQQQQKQQKHKVVGLVPASVAEMKVRNERAVNR